MSTILALNYPSSNNQLETSSNLMHQVAMPERQTLSYMGNCSMGNDQIARPYTQSKKIQCLKQQMLLPQLQEAGIQLSKDQLSILADTGERIDFGLGAFTVTTNALFQVDGVEVCDLDCDDVPNAQPSFMANTSSYGSDALAEVHNPDNLDNNMINQGVQVMSSSEQSNVVNHSETEITSDSNIIPYSHQVINCTKINLDNKSVNDSLTTELERYKEQVKVLKKGQNVDLKSKDNVSDSCEQFVEIDRLKQILSEHVKEKESLMQTVTLLKNDFKKEESRNIDREIALEKKIKQLDNIIFKKDQSAQTVYMLTKPRFFYDHTTKQALDHSPSCRPTKVEVPKELPKVSMCLKLETEHLNKKDFIEKETYDKLFRSHTTLEKHCISLEVNTQLTQSQEKDMVIKKLKERIKSLSGNMNEDKIKKDIEEIETINIKLDHRVSKLITENEHLKQTYKQLYDSIKPTRIRSKEQCDALINQVNQKSMEISDLNASLREKVVVITALKNELRKLKGKDLANNVVTKNTIAPEMLKIDVEPIAPKLLNNRTTHSDYLRHTQEQAVILREELLIIIRQTCPSINNSSDKLVAVTPKNKDKRVRFTEPVTSSRNTNINTAYSSNLVSNKPMLSSTGVIPSTSASGSHPSGNTKKDKIQQTPSTQNNKVEAHPRTVKSSLKNKNCVEPKGTANVQNSKLNANSELLCVKCNGCMLSDNHDLCVLDFINDVNARAKSKSVKKSSKRKVWKPTGKVFTNIGYIWRHTSRTFTIVENACPLTRITKTTEVPLRKPTALKSDTPKPVVTLVYSRKPRKSKTNVPVSKPKIIKSISANNKEPSKSWGSIVSNVPSSSLDECRLSKLFSGIWTPAAPSI
ncbi:hypothetical protein Tco_1287559 [Tanacetum coccineum]